MEKVCKNCVYAEMVAKEGEVFTIRDPLGNEINRVYEASAYLCRFAPPLTGQWPIVQSDDWCGQYSS
jgi:hypothetical protein